MSDSSTFATVTTNFAQQTSQAPAPVSTPPLLPAFLITGLLLAAIVCIIVWRHLIERRNVQRDDDPTWPTGGIASSGGGPRGPKPKLWDLEVKNEGEGATWGNIMPLSATTLRATPKPLRPQYLVPSDRPIPFFTRMFGGERRPPRLGQPPAVSVLAPTQSLSRVQPPDDHDDNKEPIDRLQVAVLISLPSPRRVRRGSYLPEKVREGTDIRSPLPEYGHPKDVKEGWEPEDSYKGKKRSFEKPPSHGYKPKAYDEYDDDEGLLEVAFGSVMIPFVEQG